MKKMLIADDHVDILGISAELFRMHGFAVHTTSQARDIVALVRQHQPDVLLQDAEMPMLDFLQTVQDVRAARKGRLLVFLFTGSVHAEQLLAESGADGIIMKPFDITKTVRMIERKLAVATPP